MIYKSFKKLRKVICLFVMICIIIPLVSACSENENQLSISKKSQIIGKGANIEAYTTYSQAQLLEMDKQLYHSYLLSMRDFILVVIPEGEEGTPDMSNPMFQAIYNGVTPYAESIINGNFGFVNPEYKLLIYYVFADDFLSWEEKANEENDKTFLASALDFLGPSQLDNYEVNYDTGKLDVSVDAKVIRNPENYNLKNVVNANKYVSECDFLRVTKNSSRYTIANYNGVTNTTALTKCGDTNGDGIPNGKNVIADVYNGASKGVTLLFSGGGLSGYFTDEDVEGYNFENVSWITRLANQHGGSMGNYMSKAIEDMCRQTDIESIKKSDGTEVGICSNSSIYVDQMIYKLKYDMALLGRIRKINYNTLLDINANTSIVNSVTSKSKDEYLTLLDGRKDAKYNNGNYITFTTAEGFIFDRGNIVMEAGADLLFNTNFLEFMTQIDACTNRTLASYVAEFLATVGIGVGIGLAVGGAAMAVVGTLVSVGAVSSSVPVWGWIVGAVCLIAAGVTLAVVSASTKKAINDTDSANFCEEYKKALNALIEDEYIKTPIYTYNIPRDAEYTTELCYGEYVEGEGCVSGASVPAFYMADVNEVKEFNKLSGAPSLRLYSNGEFVDEIYGAASPTFIAAIMDSWGVTSASNMKYYVDKQEDNASFNVYDLLYVNSDRTTTVTDIHYCISMEYGKPCSTSGTNITTFGGNFNNKGTLKITPNSAFYELDPIWKDSQTATTRNYYNEKKSRELDAYRKKLLDIATKYSDLQVANDGEYFVTLEGNKYYISEENGVIKLTFMGDVITAQEGIFIYDDLKFKIEKDDQNGYTISVWESVVGVMDQINNLFKNNGTLKISEYQTKLKTEFESNNSEGAIHLINSIGDELAGIMYPTVELPIYFTVTVTESDGSVTPTSVLYSNEMFEVSYSYVAEQGGN